MFCFPNPMYKQYRANPQKYTGRIDADIAYLPASACHKKLMNLICAGISDTDSKSYGSTQGPFNRILKKSCHTKYPQYHIGKHMRCLSGNMLIPVSYTHLRAHETRHDLVCR